MRSGVGAGIGALFSAILSPSMNRGRPGQVPVRRQRKARELCLSSRAVCRRCVLSRATSLTHVTAHSDGSGLGCMGDRAYPLDRG
jgi:hypothetical protein